MSIPPVSPINLGLIGALDRIGIKGSNLPGIHDGIQPVLILGDIHDSVASEIVEARKQCQFFSGAVIGNWHVLWVTALSGGGIVVESLFGATEYPAIPALRIPLLRLNLGGLVTADVPGTPPQIDVGGVATVSQAKSVASNTDPSAAGVPQSFLACPNKVTTLFGDLYTGDYPTRIFVRPSETLSLSTVDPGKAMSVSITWRELPDIQGGL